MSFVMKNVYLHLVLVSLLSGGVMGLPAVAADPIRNREPVEDDIGYLPREGAVARTNPPALAWLPEKAAEAYLVQLARDNRFTQGRLEIGRTPYSLYTHTATLAPGEWWWRYAYIDAAGTPSGWSKVRTFTIASDAQPFPRPTEQLIKESLPAQHPRLMLRPEEVSLFRVATQGSRREHWARIIQQAEKDLELPLIPEPPPWTNGRWNAAEWRHNYGEALRVATVTENLAFCYLMTSDRRYAEAAQKWLLHFATWNPLGSTSMAVNDEAGMPILYLTSRAYDWLYAYLDEPTRATIRKMAQARGEEAYGWLRKKNHEQKAYNSHAGRMWHFLGEAALAYHGEIPEAKKWLEYALSIFWAWYPAYGDEDGGWAQGYTYWSVYVNRSTWWHDALLAGLKIDGPKSLSIATSAGSPCTSRLPAGR